MELKRGDFVKFEDDADCFVVFVTKKIQTNDSFAGRVICIVYGDTYTLNEKSNEWSIGAWKTNWTKVTPVFEEVA